MEADRLLAVLLDLEADAANGYETELGALITAYAQARDNPGQDNSENLVEARNELNATLSASRVNTFVPSKRHVLVAIGAADLFGDGARARLDAALAGAPTPAGAVKALESVRTELKGFRAAIANVKKGFDHFEIEPSALSDGECEVGLRIPESITHGTLADLNEQLDRWNKALRGFWELAGDEEREIQIRGAGTGSIEIWLAGGTAAVALVAKAIDKLTELYKRTLEIRKLRLELAAKGAPVAEAEEVKKFEQQILNQGIDGLVKELIAATRVDSHRKNELKIQITHSVQLMASFIDRGGDIEVSVPEVIDVEVEDEADNESESPEAESSPEAEQRASALEAAKAHQRLLEEIRRRGSAVALLPAGEIREAVFQLPSGEEPEDEPKPKKKPDK